MTSQQLGLLCIQLAVSLGVVGFITLCLLRSNESSLKYSVFAVRDKFLFLAATDILPQGSMIFEVFYGAMNAFISEIDSLTIVSFIRASIAVRSQLEKENRERLLESLQRADPQVRQTVDEFLRIVMRALRYNSPMLSLILVFARHSARLFSFLKRIRVFPSPVYDTYRYYETIHGNMRIV